MGKRKLVEDLPAGMLRVNDQQGDRQGSIACPLFLLLSWSQDCYPRVSIKEITFLQGTAQALSLNQSKKIFWI